MFRLHLGIAKTNTTQAIFQWISRMAGLQSSSDVTILLDNCH